METATTVAGDEATEARKQRGADLAQRLRITRKAPGVYVVPSSKPPTAGKSAAFYEVHTGAKGKRCSCPDFELRNAPCKHLFAVEYSRRSETMGDGSTKTVETLRVTYAQNWTAYNAAQTHEKEHVTGLLRDLCDGIAEEPQTGKGQRRLPIGDRLFSVVWKVYCGDSARRSDTDIRDMHARGFLSKAPAFNSVIRYMEDAELTPILHQLIRESAAPLSAVETTLAIDSSGFSTCNYVRWFDHKYGREHQEKVWLKAHVAVGPVTNVITAAKITDSADHDSPQLPELLAASREHFTPHEVLADKGYLSTDNASAIANAGAFPYIPFKSNSTGRGTHKKPRADGFTGPAWLSDINPSIVDAWTAIRDDAEGLIHRLGKFENTEAEFKRVRSWDRSVIGPEMNAARVIYLNKTCWNGVWRENAAGQNNVPFGHRKNVLICDAEGLRAASVALQSTSIRCCAFNEMGWQPQEGDFVYLDPPYQPVSQTAAFTTFSRGGFSIDDQIAVRNLAVEWGQRGASVVISNSSTREMRELYRRDFSVKTVRMARAINSKASARGPVGELLAAGRGRG